LKDSLEMGLGKMDLGFSLMGFLLVFFLEWKSWRRGKDIFSGFFANSAWVRWATYYLLVLLVLLFSYDSHATFIYFRF